jgi:hypothetical protein
VPSIKIRQFHLSKHAEDFLSRLISFKCDVLQTSGYLDHTRIFVLGGWYPAVVYLRGFPVDVCLVGDRGLAAFAEEAGDL